MELSPAQAISKLGMADVPIELQLEALDVCAISAMVPNLASIRVSGESGSGIRVSESVMERIRLNALPDAVEAAVARGSFVRLNALFALRNDNRLPETEPAIERATILMGKLVDVIIEKGRTRQMNGLIRSGRLDSGMLEKLVASAPEVVANAVKNRKFYAISEFLQSDLFTNPMKAKAMRKAAGIEDVGMAMEAFSVAEVAMHNDVSRELRMRNSGKRPQWMQRMDEEERKNSKFERRIVLLAYAYLGKTCNAALKRKLAR